MQILSNTNQGQAMQAQLERFMDEVLNQLSSIDSPVVLNSRANQLLALDSARERLSSLMDPKQIEIVDDLISRENRSIATTFGVPDESVYIEFIDLDSNADLQFETVKRAILRLVEEAERPNKKATDVQRARNIQQLRTLLPKPI
ncbi:MAG: hypothetical protein IIC60_10550 [Proteobacteria bacterium]|nr:hypothetical protein [Pseudomonadota bacterium]